MPGRPKSLTRLLPLIALLSGCESSLTVDLTDGPVDDADEVVLNLKSVKLLTEDDEVVTLSLDDDTPFNLLDYRNGATYRLVSGASVDNQRYVGIALVFDSDGSYVTRSDGGVVTIETPSVLDFSDIDLTIGDQDDKDLVLDLNLRFSLIDTGTGTYDLEPVVRAVQPGSTGTITGAVAASIVEGDDCRQGRALTAGVAVYAFEGSSATPADYDGQNSLVDAASVALDDASGDYRYELHYLPEGSYTLALTCEADEDDPAAADGIAFEDSDTVTVDAGETSELDF